MPALTDLPTISQGSHPAPGPLDVDVWRHYHGAGMGDERIVALLALLSPDEHERMACLRDDRRRRNFLVGRALCRHVLSRYAPVLSSPLWFSLSHADGVSVCAVTGAGPEIGIDIERSALGRDALEVAEQFFPDAEVGALRALSPAMRGEAFMRLWALKESIVKARETSLGEGLCGTAFDLSRLDDIGVAFAESLHEREKPWQFRLFQLDKGLIVALALHTHATGPLRLHSAICVPQ